MKSHKIGIPILAGLILMYGGQPGAAKKVNQSVTGNRVGTTTPGKVAGGTETSTT